jgi:hypothetical protein
MSKNVDLRHFANGVLNNYKISKESFSDCAKFGMIEVSKMLWEVRHENFVRNGPKEH